MNQAEIEHLLKTGAALATFTVYRHPLDYPGQWVARRWVVLPGQAEPRPDPAPLAVCETVDGVREAIMRSSPGAVRVLADIADDPCIVETWL